MRARFHPNGELAESCPFCHSSELRLIDHTVDCGQCGAVGPEGESDAEAVALWNAAPRAPSTMAVVVVHEERHPQFPNAVEMTLRYGTVLLCEISYCRDELAPTLRGALTLMGGQHQAKEHELHG